MRFEASIRPRIKAAVVVGVPVANVHSEDWLPDKASEHAGHVAMSVGNGTGTGIVVVVSCMGAIEGLFQIVKGNLESST